MISAMATKAKKAQAPVQIRRGAKTHYYIKEHQEALGVSDETLGGRLGVDRTTVWKWANEQWRLRPAKVDAIEDALGLERGQLSRMPNAPAKESIDALVAEAPDNVRQAIVEFAKKIVGRGS